MLTYQVRKRILMATDPAKPLRFPNEGEVQFTLVPGGPFGSGELSANLLLLGVHVSLVPELNTGRYVRSAPQYMEPVSINSVTGAASMQMQGNVVSVKRLFRSEDELAALIQSIHFGLPVVLTLQFRDAPVVSMVTGNLGGAEFVWAYAEYVVPWQTTTKEIQEQHFLESWERLEMLLPNQNIRLFAALNYLHIARRLALVGITPWEFMGEALLNLSKLLQVLFPGPEGQTIDAARDGLAKLGYTSDNINQWYIPAIALRNELDVAHVSLSTLTRQQRQVVYKYTDQAEDHFRELLLRVIDGIVAGTFILPPYTPGTKHLEVIRRLSSYFPPEE